MSVEARERFAGLQTNAAGPVAANGALEEAENVVIRKPGAVEPRDGLRAASGMNGQEVWGYSHGPRDLVVRYSPVTELFTHRNVSGGPVSNAPQPLRRDILTSAVARGNLYMPGDDGVRRLLPGSNAFESTGLILEHEFWEDAPGALLTQGPIAPVPATGVTGLSPSTYLENAAGQGPVPAAQWWLAVMFFLNAVPVTAETLVSRGKGVHPAGTGFILSIQPTNYYMSQVVSGVYHPDTAFPISAAHVGRMHLLVYAFSGGVGRIWLDGVPGATVSHATLPVDPTDLTQWGNSKLFPTTSPLQSAVLISSARGTGLINQAVVDQFYADTKANGAMTLNPGMAASQQWSFATVPPTSPVGGQVVTLTGPIPSLRAEMTLWPGEPDPYPSEFWLPRGYHVNYRLVAYEKDPDNGLVRRSVPGPVFEVVNPESSTGGAAYVNLAFAHVLFGTSPYDTIELYRSRAYPLDILVDDEMQLVTTLPDYTSFFSDQIPQESRGATLYTSPSRGGILQQNDPPPACACVATFKGSLFFGNTRGPATITLSSSPNLEGFPDYPLSGQTGGIGERKYSGTATNGSNVLTGFVGLEGIEPGQRVWSNDPGQAVFAALVTEVDTASGTVTVELPAVATATTDFIFADVLIFEDGSWVNAAPIAFSPIDYTTTEIVPPLAGKDRTVVVATRTRAERPANLTMRATHGSEYSPPLPPLGGPSKAWDQDVFPGGLMWSKTDEPEHVAPINYAFVGDQKRAILGLVPTRDALFILKEDGVFRLTGVNATWRIDPYDPTLFCCLPMSVCPLQEQAYFLSNKGVIAFSDAGSEMISGPINDQVKPVIDQVYYTFRQTGFYELPEIIGSVAAVYERENEYTLMRGLGEAAWVYNRNTSAWTTVYPHATPPEADYLVNVFTAAYAGRVVYVRHGIVGDDTPPRSARWTWLSTDESLAGLVRPRFDSESEVTINAGAGGVAPSVILSAPVTVLADDVIVDGAGQVWLVAQATTDALIQLVPRRTSTGIFATPSTGDGFLYRTIRATVTPIAFDTPPPRPKHWRALSTAFAEFDGPVTLRYAYASSESPRVGVPWDEESADFVRSPEGLIVYPMGYSYSGLVPHAHARAWSLRGSVRWAMYQGFVSLEGIFVDANPLELGRQQKAAP